jgi:hypothetical protein
MRASFGNGGWVQIEAVDLPGPLYVRVRDVDGRLRISEFYLDSSPGSGVIEHADLQDIPLRQTEAFLNHHADEVRARIDLPSPDLSVYASYFSTWFGNWHRHLSEGNWVVASLIAQRLPPGQKRGAVLKTDIAGEETLATGEDMESAGPDALPVMKVPRTRRISETKWRDVETTFRLTSGPVDGLTDAFLADVARAYASAVARGERPNAAIRDQLGGEEKVPLKTVQRWVYTARQRGIMPRGTKGAPG